MFIFLYKFILYTPVMISDNMYVNNVQNKYMTFYFELDFI